jgi:predicted acylesterase/phospholipase RssA
LEWGTLLVAQATGRRDENEVEKALALLKKTIATLPKAVAQARAEGPFQDTYVEKARLALLDFLEQEITLFERFQECLESGKNWTKEKMAQLERQQEKVKEATRYWKTFLKSS